MCLQDFVLLQAVIKPVLFIFKQRPIIPENGHSHEAKQATSVVKL